MKKNTILLFFTLIILICPFFYPQIGDAQTNRSAEVDNYLNLLKSNNYFKRINVAKLITTSGLTDEKIFNYIKDKLLDEFQTNTGSRAHIDEMAWLCKALASSGNSNYIDTLKTVINNTFSSKLKRYAKQSIGLIKESAIRNTIMADDKYTKPGQSQEITRYINMLKSDVNRLQKDAAKEITRSSFTNQELFKVVNEELINGYQKNIRDKDQIDTMAWLCKALAASGDKQYKATLEKIAKNTSNSTLRKFAQDSLDML